MRFTISFIEKDVQLITLIIIVLTAEALWHTQSLMTPPPPPLFSFLKTIQCLPVTFNLDSKCGTKDRHWCKQKCDLDDLRRLHPLSPEDAPQTSRWGVGELVAEMRMRTCTCLLSDINIRFAKEKMEHLYFYLCFAFSKG